MLIRLCSYGLFKLADHVLNFPDTLFSSAIIFQVGVLGNFADFLLDCPFDFVELACRLIFRAWFHHDLLLCSVVGFNELRPIERPFAWSICDSVRFSSGSTLARSEEHTSELQSLRHLVCRLL